MARDSHDSISVLKKFRQLTDIPPLLHVHVYQKLGCRYTFFRFSKYASWRQFHRFPRSSLAMKRQHQYFVNIHMCDELAGKEANGNLLFCSSLYFR